MCAVRGWPKAVASGASNCILHNRMNRQTLLLHAALNLECVSVNNVLVEAHACI